MRINVVVKTGCKHQSLEEFDNYLKVNLKSQPENNKANLELIKLLKKHYKKDPKIVSGLTSKKKVIEF